MTDVNVRYSVNRWTPVDGRSMLQDTTSPDCVWMSLLDRLSCH